MNRVIDKRYKLLDVVGEGGMSVVYKAEDLKTGDLVAVKILKSEFNDDDDIVRRFRIESEAIQKLNHPNIVKIFDLGDDEGQHFIILELLKPQTLKDVIMQKKTYFNNEEIINMSLQILSGMKIAHDNNIVHRDIKPQNILVGADGLLKISDFGIASMVSSDTMKNMKDAIGSVHYASPEQSRGSVVNERSDIYSFGIMLYEISTGRLPFQGDTAISIAMKHTRGGYVNPSKLNLNLNPSIAAIIQKCVQIHSSQRFQDADELINLFIELKNNPDEELGAEFSELIVVPTETINMNSISPFLDGEKEEINKVELKEEKTKVNVVPLIVTVVSAVAIGVLILIVAFMGSNREVEKLKPFKLDDLTEMNFTDASELLSSRKLKIEKVDSIYDDEIKANSIISQVPKADTTVKAGRTVKVVVSLGKKDVEAPDVEGKLIEEARVILNNENIEFEIEEEYSDEEMGKIIKQWPKSGRLLQKGDKLTVTISLGEKAQEHSMPNLYNVHKDNAQKIIMDSNLILTNMEYKYSDTIAKDYVMWQSVASDTTVKDGDIVSLTVSLGEKVEGEGEAQDKTGTSEISSGSESESGEASGSENESGGTSGSENESGSTAKSTEDELVTKSYSIPLKHDKEEYKVKVIKVVGGVEEVLHEAVHPSADGMVTVQVKGKGSMKLKVYIDDAFFDEMDITL